MGLDLLDWTKVVQAASEDNTVAELRAKHPPLELEKMRVAKAEGVCWTVMLMMGLGLLNIPDDERSMLGDPMQEWADLAAATGILKDD